MKSKPNQSREKYTGFRGTSQKPKIVRWKDDTDVHEKNHHQHQSRSNETDSPNVRAEPIRYQEEVDSNVHETNDHHEHGLRDQSPPPDAKDEYDGATDQTRPSSGFENGNDHDLTVDGDGKDNDGHETPAPLQPIFEESIPTLATPETLDSRSPVDATNDIDGEETNVPPKDSPTEPRQNRRRLALIFGNDTYAPPHNLHSCCKDARDMEKMLTSLGFDCTVLLNGRKRGMLSTERSFRDKLRQGDCVLVYFSGHSMEDKVRGNESSLFHHRYKFLFERLFQGINYLVPIYRPGEKIDPEYDFVCIEDMLKRLNEKRDIINIVILDACRTDENTRRFKKSGCGSGRDSAVFGKSLSIRMDTPDDAEYCLIYSCEPGRVSLASGPGENSFFTAALLESIAQPGLEMEEVVKETLKQLKRSTGGQQRSWCNSCLTESFIFNRRF